LRLEVEGTLSHSDRGSTNMAEDTGRQPAEQSSCGCSSQQAIDRGNRSQEPEKGKARTQRKKASVARTLRRPSAV
jgi:hypothetical protein